jgi:hypothetical protein
MEIDSYKHGITARVETIKSTHAGTKWTERVVLSQNFQAKSKFLADQHLRCGGRVSTGLACQNYLVNAAVGIAA